MPRRPLHPRSLAAAALLGAVSLLSCGREVTGPGGRGRTAEVFLDPRFETVRLEGNGQPLSIADVVDFARVRIVLLRTNGDTAAVRTIDFPPGADSVALSVSVTLSDAATGEGEPFSATMQYVTAAGDTVFRAGPATVIARPAGGTPPVPPVIPVRYAGPGANAASLVMTPTEFTGTTDQTVPFTAVVRDAANAILASAPVAFTSTDSQRVSVDLRTGLARLRGVRGSALIVGQTLTGQADTSLVTITPTAAQLLLVSGGNQQVRQGSPFPNPVRVRVNAADGLGVAGVPVAFAVTAGGGSTSQPVDTTDANGLAEVTWTAGDVAGAAQLQASVAGTPALQLLVNGTQLSAAPTALTFEPQPVTIAAGDALPAFDVVVRDATADTVRGFTGTVQLTLTGGTVGATLVGGRAVAAVNGVARFSELTVDRDGANYRLVASIVDGPTAQSNPFTVTPSAPAFVTAIAGLGQSVPPSTVLPDSIAVRVTDLFGLPKAGVTVNWSVASGGGTVSPATSVTDATGRAAAQWTVGASGAQQLRAQVGLLEPTTIAATLVLDGGTPRLFLPIDTVAVAVGRTRPVTLYLSSPTPTPLTVDLATRGVAAQWTTAQVTIPAGGTQGTAGLTGLLAGTTWAVATSIAGTDSLLVVVDTAAAAIDLSIGQPATVGDTIRTTVFLEEPAPAGGLVVTVRSTDSSRVLVAPGTGLGALEPPCEFCGNLVASGATPAAAPAGEGAKLLAPPSGTAVITIPQGQLRGQLVVLPVAPAAGEGTPVTLTLDAPGFVGNGTSLVPRAARLNLDCYQCAAGVGQRVGYSVSIERPMRRDVPVRVRSLDPAVAVVDDSLLTVVTADYVTWIDPQVRGVAAGLARIEASSPGFEPDTLTLEVHPAQLGTFGASLTLDRGARSYLGVYTGYSNGGFFGTGASVATPLAVTHTVRDPAIVSLDRPAFTIAAGEYYGETTVRALQVGSTYIVHTAPGYAPDSTAVTVYSGVIDASTNPTTIGVGLEDPEFAVRLGDGPRAEATTLSVSSSDPVRIRVLTPEVPVGAQDTYAYVRLRANNAGTATLTFAAPGFDTTTVVLTAGQAGLRLGSFATPTSLDADSSLRQLQVYALTVVTGQVMPVTDSVEVRIRSTDPAVLLVTDSIAVIPTGEAYALGGLVRPIAPGTARLVASAMNGFADDTSALITVRPLRLVFSGTSLSAGNGLITGVPLTRVTPPSAPLIVSLSRSGPSGTGLVQAVDTFPAGTATISVGVIGGETPGTDTVIATAPGLAPDTILVTSGQGRFTFGSLSRVEVGASQDFVTGYLVAPNGFSRPTALARRVRVVSRDTTILRVTADTLDFPAGSQFPATSVSVAGVQPGSAWLVGTLEDGSLLPDSIRVPVTLPRLYHSENTTLVLGMQQRTYDGELYVWRDGAPVDSVWVRLASSAPGIMQVPDSVLIEPGEYYAYYQVTAADTVGSATVTFSAPGHLGGSFRTVVTRNRADLSLYDDIPAPGGVATQVFAYNDGGYIRPFTVDIPIQLGVGDATRATLPVDTTVIPAGWYEAEERVVRGVAPGITQVTASDRRTADFARLVPSVRDALVEQAGIRLGEDVYDVAIGAGAAYNEYAELLHYGVDDVAVRIRTLNGRARVVEDSLFFGRFDVYQAFRLAGVTPGVDTLVLEIPGYRTDSAVVRVSEGILRNQLTLPATIQAGDSTRLLMGLQSVIGAYVYPVEAPVTLTFAPSPGIEVRRGGVVVTTADLLDGDSNVEVWVRGVTAGPASLTVSAPGFRSVTYVLQVRNPPD